MRAILPVLLLLAACPGGPQPVPCPPFCVEPSPTAGATATPTATPTLIVTATPTPPPSATPSPSPTPLPVVQPGIRGHARFLLDLHKFKLPAGQDKFAFVAMTFRDPGADPVEMPALQLSVAGTRPEPCVQKPCQGRLAVEGRWSSNPRHDKTEPDEDLHCGEGTKPPRWMPLGNGPLLYAIDVFWEPGLIRILTPAGEVRFSQGAEFPAFGWWAPGIGRVPGGIGWYYREIDQAQYHGAVVHLLSWEASGDVNNLPGCP